MQGDLAGPRVLEHLVDTVVQMEGGRQSPVRLVRQRGRGGEGEGGGARGTTPNPGPAPHPASRGGEASLPPGGLAGFCLGPLPHM